MLTITGQILSIAFQSNNNKDEHYGNTGCGVFKQKYFFLCWFLVKNISSFVPPFENSTSHIAIMNNIILKYATETLDTYIMNQGKRTLST